jgi:LmbE family N-acetylglucosaminyl deacetylase
MKHRFLLLLISFISSEFIFAQAPKSYSSADLLLQLQKLEVFGSVLYIAAHPDDENTRLLGYLANEKKYRTGYLSLTRGDGGQNLIGDEQGVDLGLIRTQELLSARNIDGAQQFFTRAYDFGYCKNPEEALQFWDHDLVLADVVWVIRKFKPDVIITRFPTTGEGGHGHHTASAILAGEAFEMAADSTKFKEQLTEVKPWQAKRLLWNTFNFGGNNTTRENQFKIDCGVYNALLGKSYGEIAAESRSRHKSQGFGVPAQRGKNVEYFSLIKGANFTTDLLEGIDSAKLETPAAKEYFLMVKDIIKNFEFTNPKKIVKPLMALYNASFEMPFITAEKRHNIAELIKNCAGIFFEANAINQLNTVGDSMKVKLNIINRAGIKMKDAQAIWNKETYSFANLSSNDNKEIIATQKISATETLTQPYFLVNPKKIGSYTAKQTDIGKPEKFDATVNFKIDIEGDYFEFTTPITYKYTDPVKGELYEPIQIIAQVFVNVSPNIVLLKNNSVKEIKKINFQIQSNTILTGKMKLFANATNKSTLVLDSTLSFKKMQTIPFEININNADYTNNSETKLNAAAEFEQINLPQTNALRKISYDHIPNIFYNYVDYVKVLKLDLQTAGTKAGYIIGAGDKVPQTLEQMGYSVTFLTEKDITTTNLKQFDVIIAGVRAYNIHDWLSKAYPTLLEFVKNGGTYLVQYNTNNSLGPVKASMAPYPFTISRNRVTDETAPVNFLLPKHPVLNFPNIITTKDFEGWVQERSIYNAEKIDTAYQKIISMADPKEAAQDGSLIVTDYGKGRFIYTGLVFFRELPAAVPGAYRLFANLIAKRKNK